MPFRPKNLNKRLYPGNASIIGPTKQTSCTSNVSDCCNAYSRIGATTGPNNVLGCRFTYCTCPFCTVCCSCPCTVVCRDVPPGVYKVSEVLDARKRDSWSNVDDFITGAEVVVCNLNCGTSLSSACNDCAGFFVCCGPSTTKWFIAPQCTEVSRTAGGRFDACTVACNCMGNCGWFIGDNSQMQNPAGNCRVYWDCYCATEKYWTSQSAGSADTFWLDMNNNSVYYSAFNNNSTAFARSLRCLPS